MANYSFQRNDILIDKRLLAINFDELSLLQSCLFVPKPVNLLALKRRFGMYIGTPDLLQELKDPRSPIFKYLQSLIICQIARILWVREDNIKQLLHVIARKQKDQAYRLLIDEIRTAKAYARYHALKLDVPTNLSFLPPNILIKTEEALPLKHFLLQASKYEDLKFYLRFAKNKDSLKTIYDLIEQRYQLIEKNLKRLDAKKASAMTAEEKSYAMELEERYLRHLELSSLENMQKHLSEINLEDQKVLEQHLRKMVVDEEFLSESKIDNKSYLLGTHNRFYSAKVININPIFNSEELASIHCKELLDKLNNELTIILDENKDCITEGFAELSTLISMLYDFVSKNNSSFFYKKIVDRILIIKSILDHNPKNYNNLLTLLNIWLHKNQLLENRGTLEIDKKNCTQTITGKNDGEQSYQKLLEIIEVMEEDQSFTKEERILVEKIHANLMHGYEKLNSEQLTLYFNELVEHLPNSDITNKIYQHLILLPCVNITEIIQPKSENDLAL